MRRLFLFMVTVTLSLFNVYAEELTCVLIPDKYEIKADGKDGVSFKVAIRDINGNIKKGVKYSVVEAGKKIEGLYRTTVPGVYYFKAVAGKLESRSVIITAVPSKKGLLKKYILKDGENNVRIETTYEYDKYGNAVKSLNKTAEGVVIERYTEYIYDKKGNILKSSFKDKDGNITGYNEYEYDQKYNQVRFVQKNKDGAITSENEWQYSFDKNGKKQTEQKVVKDRNGNITNVRETMFDDKGRKILEKQVFRDRKGNTVLETETRFDMYGNKVREENRNKDGLVVKVTDFEYSRDGNTAFEITKDRNGIVTNKKEYIVDKDASGLKIKQTVKMIDEGGILVSISENYYDRYGNMIKYVLKDAEGNMSEFGEVKYDKYGNIIQELTYDKENKLLSMAVSEY